MSNEDRIAIVRAILFEDWDPVVCSPFRPADEYDSFIPGVIKLLESHCTADQAASLRRDGLLADCTKFLGSDVTFTYVTSEPKKERDFGSKNLRYNGFHRLDLTSAPMRVYRHAAKNAHCAYLLLTNSFNRECRPTRS
jgi:hypothetical protein